MTSPEIISEENLSQILELITKTDDKDANKYRTQISNIFKHLQQQISKDFTKIPQYSSIDIAIFGDWYREVFVWYESDGKNPFTYFWGQKNSNWLDKPMKQDEIKKLTKLGLLTPASQARPSQAPNLD